VSDVVAAALEWLASGGCPVPAREDGSKRPLGLWKDRQAQRPSEADVRAWNGARGYGIVCGSVSGNLDMLEFEGRAIAEGFLDEFTRRVRAAGLTDLWHRVIAGYSEQTPSGGLHLCYRLDGEVPGNTQLARRPETQAEMDAREMDAWEIRKGAKKPRPVVLIETRGEGGFTVTAPSNGSTHATGRPWVLLAGGPRFLATITIAERDALHAVAKSLDTMPVRVPATGSHQATVVAAAGTGGRYWADILIPAGWEHEGYDPKYGDLWTRPGKSEGVSASSKEDAGLYVYSTSTEFEAEVPYSKAAVIAVYEEGLDPADALARHGTPAQARAAADEAMLASLGTSSAGLAARRQAVMTDAVMIPPAPALSAPATVIPRFTRVKASMRTAEPVPWLWEPYLVRGALNLLAGYEGAGKSMVSTWMISQVTRGGWGMPAAVALVVATEDHWNTTIQPRLIAAGADLDLVEQLVVPEGAPELTFPDDCMALEQEIRESGASVVVLDPLLSRVAERFDTHKDAEVRQALEPLKKVLERTGCAALGLMHWSKNTTAHNPLDRLMGSRAFSAVTRSTLVVAPHPENLDAKVLAHAKSNVGRHGHAMTFEICSWADPGNAAITAGYVRFLDKLEEFCLEDSFEVKRREKPDVVVVAAEFVRDMLARNDGAVRTDDMTRAAVKAGVAMRTLKMAEVKVLADADVCAVLGEKSSFAWCRKGMEPAEMMRALARTRAGGQILCVGGTDLSESNEKEENQSLSGGSVMPTHEIRPPARESSARPGLSPAQQRLFDQLMCEDCKSAGKRCERHSQEGTTA